VDRSPAFQFYPKDFLSDLNVRVMTWEQKGIYTELLCHCWLEDGIQKELVERWFNGGSEVLQPVLKCFYEKDGKYHHKRLDHEREKQQEWSQKSKYGGIKSGESRRARPVKRRNRINNEGWLNQTRTKGEPNTNISSSSSSSSSSSDSIEIGNNTLLHFDKWWLKYPRKLGKKDALKVYEQILKTASPEDVEKALDNYIEDIRAKGTEEKYIKHPTTFLREERWKDYLTLKPGAQRLLPKWAEDALERQKKK
jgi:uncharacterized protein YdaU (DUF1376 family)